jgi:diaminohydroxyphosphoribosylaminopyrimidine deaminase/5-amino-6-(5-phosphoribosylamino)uracil reductase
VQIDNNFYMNLAIDKAWEYQLLTYPNPAVGAVVIKDGAILSIEAHKRAGSSHAEVLALIGAYEKLSGQKAKFNSLDANKAHNFLLSLPKDFFKGCEIYVTLEPCSHIGKTPSCASLIANLNLKKVYIGSIDPIKEHSGGFEMLKRAGIKVEFGIMQQECDALIEPFIIWQKRAFVVFKLAQSSNGEIGCGYISSKESLKHVHKIREVCTKLLIGGNTVRVDRPTLDCRFIDAKAPNIYIYSKDSNFDKTIPLFSVPKRDVDVGNSLDFLDKKGLVLVEGGEGMLKAMQKKIDWLLIFQAPKLMANCLSYNITTKLQFLHTKQTSNDLIIWSRVLG